MREALLLDLGAIIFEQHRQERREPELLQAKAAELEAVDDEVRALADALGEGHGLPQLTARGLIAACTSCGGIMGVRDRHCPGCGAPAGAEPQLDGGEEPAAPEEPDVDEETEPAQEPPDWPDSPTEEWSVEDDYAEPSDHAEPLGNGEPAGNGGAPAFEETRGPAHLPRAPWAGGPNGEHAATPRAAEAPPGGAAYGPRDQLVPRAQATLRAGRRLARAWIDGRRSGRR